MSYTIYGQAGCGPCQQAKSLLDSKGLTYDYIDIRNLIPVELEDFKEKHRSVPQIYLKDEYIGGLNELKAKLI